MGISSGAVQTKKSSYGMSALAVTECHRLLQLQDTQPAVDQLRIPRRYQERDIVKQASPVAWHNINLRDLPLRIERKIARSGGAYALNRGYLPLAKVHPLEATDGAASRALCRFWTEIRTIPFCH